VRYAVQVLLAAECLATST